MDRRLVRRLAETTGGYIGRLRLVQAEIANFGLERTCARYQHDGAGSLGIENAYSPLVRLCSVDERDLLAALVAMAPTFIPYSAVELILREAKFDEGDHQSETADPISVLERLSALALISLSRMNGVKVEAPVRRLAGRSADVLPIASARRPAMRGLNRLLPVDTRTRMTSELATLITHARQLVNPVDSDDAALLLQRIGTFDALVGDRNGERDCFQRSYDWLKVQHGEGQRQTLEALVEVIACYKHDRSEAERTEAALRVALASVGERDEITLRLLHRQSILHGDNGDVKKALDVAERAEALALSALGAENQTTLNVQTSKALYLKVLGRRSEAYAILKSLDGLACRLFGPDDPRRLRVASNLSIVMAEFHPEQSLAL